MKDMIIGVDLAKRIFQVHGATPSGDFVYRKKAQPRAVSRILDEFTCQSRGL